LLHRAASATVRSLLERIAEAIVPAHPQNEPEPPPEIERETPA
jgi:hypothetical protein